MDNLANVIAGRLASLVEYYYSSAEHI